MPQLEQVEFFISQLFWLGVFFVILFTVLTYITLPKIRAFLNQRDDFVKSHISKQDELIKKAESIIENYEAKLTEAKNQASQIINDAKDKALKESEDLIKATEEKIQHEIKQTEERVSKEKDNAISELNDQLKDSATNFLSKITNIEKQLMQIKDPVPVSEDERNFNKKVEEILLECDKEQISRVFINLIKNSIESIEQKVEKNPDFKKKILIDTSSNNDHILISIEDNGVGFDKNNIEEILNPYYTTKKNGTGLGLSIVNKIINDHKGELEFIPITDCAKIQIRFYLNDNRNINSWW